MLRINQLEALERILAKASDVVQYYSERDSRFPNRVLAWLEELERELQNNRLTAASTIAAVKSSLISARDGALPKSIQITGRMSRQKRSRAVAAEVLRQAVEIVQTTIQLDRARINEAEPIALQLVEIARANGILDDNGPQSADNPLYIQRLAAALKSTDTTIQGIVQLEGLMGPADTLIILDRMLEFSRH